MAYYIDLFSPETYEAFGKTDRQISGFRIRQLNLAKRIFPGDKFICYLTKFSRWVGVLDIFSDAFVDETPILYFENDPFVVRFQVKPIVWLSKEKTVPIHEDDIWNHLSFTKGLEKNSSQWTGKIRGSLGNLEDEDGLFLEDLLIKQAANGKMYPLDEERFQKLAAQRQTIRRPDKPVIVTVPDTDEESSMTTPDRQTVRESTQVQASLAKLGEKMGFNVWIPKNDRGAVLKEWEPDDGTLLDVLPLSYDLTTLKTIEQIDVIWLRGRSIVRTFEVEHTTAVYSGILRMADLLALQPNMDIKLHIVAPYSRKDKVFEEIQRPVFSLLDKGPLSELCTYISYDSLNELMEQPHLAHLSDSVLEEYAEEVE